MANEINKDVLYGDWREGNKQKDALYMRAAHKALDIPEGDMNINANRTTNGISPLATVTIAAIAALVPAAIAGYLLLKPAEQAATQPAVQPQEWELQIFRQKDGKWQAKEMK